MDLILCHVTADFDAFGAAVGLSRLNPGARIVLAGGAHPAVRDFLALYRDEFALMERRSVVRNQIRTIHVVDTQLQSRLGKTAEWLALPQVHVCLYDHHPQAECDIDAQETYIEAVGATSTMIVETLQAQGIQLTLREATAMALGIHVDTGSLTYDHTTPRDAAALAWLMTQGAEVEVIAAYVDPGLSLALQTLLGEALESLKTRSVQGYTLAWVMLVTPGYVPGLSSLASRLMQLIDSDALLLANDYQRGESHVLTVIGRSRIPQTDLNQLFQPFGGGGHAKAAALTLQEVDFEATLATLVQNLTHQVPLAPTARQLMSSPVRTIRPETTIAEAQRLLLRYGHSGLSVVDGAGSLVGVISRRDLDIALHHGFSHAPVKGYMSGMVHTIHPETSLPEIEALMVTYDIGRLPVLEEGQLVGIVTRTDVLRRRSRHPTPDQTAGWAEPLDRCVLPTSLERLASPLQDLLTIAARQAQDRGWHLYLVGGGVRDLLLAPDNGPVMLNDIDLVVDGYHRSADAGAGMELAKELQMLYPEARLEVHGKFQTAALLWHQDPLLDSLWVDIATARTEFYPYPAANPEVEASSIQQDLYRRDFTINALALRLTQPESGEIIDFFGGILDLQAQRVRVLHPNSFIEDPTRIYRGVRFVTRLGFEFDAQTEVQIRHAIASGIYDQVRETQQNGRVVAPALQTRLKTELKAILQLPQWQTAIRRLGELDALKCIHPRLSLNPILWRQLRLMAHWLRHFDPEARLTQWQMLLEVLIAGIPIDAAGNGEGGGVRRQVAQQLQLTADSIDRLAHLADAEHRIAIHLPQCYRPSQMVRLLQSEDLPMLLLVGVRLPPARPAIRQHLSHWSQVKPLLDGHDLKALGYKAGKQFKPILENLLAATLDGQLGDRAAAILYLQQHYPLNPQG
jgi:tRNA nucleotidyltransferase (CCA-adding enzyme)